jgi:hypothetical protein
VRGEGAPREGGRGDEEGGLHPLPVFLQTATLTRAGEEVGKECGPLERSEFIGHGGACAVNHKIYE